MPARTARPPGHRRQGPEEERDRVHRRPLDRPRLDRARPTRWRAVIGSIVVAVGIHAPACCCVSFVPMFFIAAAFYYMNRVDPDCGTTLLLGDPGDGALLGWIGGWAICMTGILVVGSLADVSAYYTYDLFGLRRPPPTRRAAAIAIAVAIIAVMTPICVIGTELSAHLQRVLTLGAGRRSCCCSPGWRRQGLHRRRPPSSIDPRSLVLPVRARSLRVLSPASCWPSSSTGAGRARSTSPRRPRTLAGARLGRDRQHRDPARHLRRRRRGAGGLCRAQPGGEVRRRRRGARRRRRQRAGLAARHSRRDR